MTKTYTKIVDCFGQEIKPGKNQNIPIVVPYYHTMVIGRLINVIEYTDKVIVNYHAGDDKSCHSTRFSYEGTVTFRDFALLSSVKEGAFNASVQQ